MKPRRSEHIAPELVFEFDLFEDERLKGDVHQALKTLHRDAPDIFWTNTFGGHWVVTRYDLMDEILKGHDYFSSAGNRPPNAPESPPMIPINLDPPAHTYYRTILSRHFGPPAIRKLEPRVQYWAERLVNNVAHQGRCEFIEDIASLFPVSIFMEMMGLPLESLREYRALVVEYFGGPSPDRFLDLEAQIKREMREALEARQTDPRDDLLTKLQRDEVDGRRMTMAELESLTYLLFLAGMDTVANFAGFLFRYLGTRPELQRQIREQPARISQVIEEASRLFGVVNVGRLVRQDVTVGGVEMRTGDIIICMLPLAGLDERKNPDPEKFMVDRRGRDHMLFSKGVHLCIGHTLAKAEMRMLLNEWFKRIPEFRIQEGYDPLFRAGSVMGLSHLPLEWELCPAWRESSEQPHGEPRQRRSQHRK